MAVVVWNCPRGHELPVDLDTCPVCEATRLRDLRGGVRPMRAIRDAVGVVGRQPTVLLLALLLAGADALHAHLRGRVGIPLMQLIDDVIRTPVYGATIALVHQDSSGSVSWPRAASAVRRSLVALLLARLPFTLVGLLGSSLFASLVAHSFFGRAATALPLLLVGILSTCAEIFVALRLLFMAQVAVIEEKGALEIIPASWRRTRGQAMRLAALWVVFLLIWLVVIRRLGKPAAAPLLALAALFNEVVRTTAYLQVARTAEPSGGKTSATSA